MARLMPQLKPCEAMLLDEKLGTRAVVIGLYRSSRDSNGVVVRYVLTKPPADTLVRPTDEFFALVDREAEAHINSAFSSPPAPRPLVRASARASSRRSTAK